MKIIIILILSIFLEGCNNLLINQDIIQYSPQNIEDNQHKIYNIPMLSESELIN